MLTLSINGTDLQVDVPEDMPLLWVLRDVLGLTGTKYGCGIAQCGACTVHLDGQAARACVLPVGEVKGRKVVTIERIGNTELGRKVQQAWLEDEVVQCGYCQCGQIMSAVALLEQNPQPDDRAIDQGMAGNLCRCCTYTRIRSAIKRVA
nr:2Fe-2S iron-sulfur cluster binding domain-containing protein [Stutzerimonas stutzeri]